MLISTLSILTTILIGMHPKSNHLFLLYLMKNTNIYYRNNDFFFAHPPGNLSWRDNLQSVCFGHWPLPRCHKLHAKGSKSLALSEGPGQAGGGVDWLHVAGGSWAAPVAAASGDTTWSGWPSGHLHHESISRSPRIHLFSRYQLPRRTHVVVLRLLLLSTRCLQPVLSAGHLSCIRRERKFYQAARGTISIQKTKASARSANRTAAQLHGHGSSGGLWCLHAAGERLQPDFGVRSHPGVWGGDFSSDPHKPVLSVL